MKWLQLKLTMLPIVAQEINNIITEYKEIVNEIQQLTDTSETPNINFEIDKFGRQTYTNNEKDKQRQNLLIEYAQLRAQIKARMEELQTFYDENCEDDKIHFFEKLRLKLKKVL